MELVRAEEGTTDHDKLTTSPSSSATNETKAHKSSLNLVIKLCAGFVVGVLGFGIIYYFGFRPEDTESSVVHLHVDESNTDLNGLNTYFTTLKADYAADPALHATYSNMAPEGSPMFSGLEPAEFLEKLKEKFPEIGKLKPDRYIVSADVLDEDVGAKWGLLRANIRGHANQTVLLSPDQLSRVQNALSNVDDDVSPGTDDNGSPISDDDTTIKLSSISAAGTFNWDEAMTALHHAQTTYCKEDTYLDRTYGGPLTGFVATYRISNPRFDTAGYIGYHSGEQNIYISFRGTATLNNWLTTNLDADYDPYHLCDECKAHSGFMEAAQAVFPEVLSEVQRLRALYPSYKVVVTGHSLGGALSHIMALELDAYMSNIELYTYGSPRVSNDELATYSTARFPTASRVTHDKDMVVHVPGSIFYTHMAGEWHQPDDDVEVIECFGYEDENCSYQYVFTSISDHMEYLGVEMGEGGCAAVTYD